MMNVAVFSQRTVEYLAADFDTFKQLIDPKRIAEQRGRLGFPLLAAAMAAFDVYAWLLSDGKKNNQDRFEALASNRKFFDEHRYISASFFYGAIRCCIVHQLYPAETDILVRVDPRPFFSAKVAGVERLIVNAYAVFADVLGTAIKVNAYICNEATPQQKRIWSELLEQRQVDDERTRGSFDLSNRIKFPRLSEDELPLSEYTNLATSSKQ